jgi:hypothetical protein
MRVFLPTKNGLAERGALAAWRLGIGAAAGALSCKNPPRAVYRPECDSGKNEKASVLAHTGASTWSTRGPLA